MGAVRRDINLKERRLTTRYKLTDWIAVKRLLSHYDDLSAHRYWEGESYSDLLMDIDKAIELANLTEKQKLALKYGSYSSGFSFDDASVATGMSRSALQLYERMALKKIAAVFEYWGNIGEGYEAVTYRIIEPTWASYRIPNGNGSYVIIKHGKGLHVK